MLVPRSGVLLDRPDHAGFFLKVECERFRDFGTRKIVEHHKWGVTGLSSRSFKDSSKTELSVDHGDPA